MSLHFVIAADRASLQAHRGPTCLLYLQSNLTFLRLEGLSLHFSKCFPAEGPSFRAFVSSLYLPVTCIFPASLPPFSQNETEMMSWPLAYFSLIHLRLPPFFPPLLTIDRTCLCPHLARFTSRGRFISDKVVMPVETSTLYFLKQALNVVPA